ncbi:MAG: bifunctional 3-deoxy-7-phosphoheptulonate synthase/chorismate mutase [Myxococcota bacterium]
MSSEELDTLREQLDEVDRRLLDALADRHGLILQVARLKAEGEQRIRDPLREEEVLTRLVEAGRQAGLDGWYVTRLFREILDHSVRVQQEHLADLHNPDREARTILVAYQGGEGSYSQMTAMRHFGARNADVVYQGFDTFQSMLEAVRDDRADYAVLPIENTTAGSINESYDLLARMDLALVGEEIQRVDHCLVALEHVPLSAIRRVYSHPQALAQCSEFLATLHNCHVEAFTDTALAVAKIKQDHDLSQAAIASEEAARLYGLPILKRDIANQKQNYTRMVIVARRPAHYDVRIPCKTSLIFATRHEEGALARCVNLFAEHGLNLTKLESRPRPNTPWEYLFYVDFEGNLAEEHVQAAMKELASRTSYLKVLGSYPARTTKDAKPAEPRRAASEPAPALSTATAPPVSQPSATPPVESLDKAAYELASRHNRPEDTLVHVNGLVIGGTRTVVIGGPPIVESREQIRACARAVEEAGADVLWGGCWEPRTTPNAFRGLGYDGLDLLEEAGREVGLPVLTEVLHPADVERVAKKADIVLVGARNMQNFALLDEIGKVDKPVVLKRGMMASIDEWLQAAEYVLSHGNQQVILCERGIRTFETSTRNTLDLSAVPILRERTHLPVIVDPSHGVGVRRWIPPMAEAALASGAHGLMIAIHPDPTSTLGEGPESLDFDDFRALMQRLRVRAA